jgi:nicotinate-nucleotide pyrophosphorylase (carboxylating)
LAVGEVSRNGDHDYSSTIAASGVDYVSVGRLMQSAPAADIGLDFELV